MILRNRLLKQFNVKRDVNTLGENTNNRRGEYTNNGLAENRNGTNEKNKFIIKGKNTNL